jgi:MFS transporter, DHA1 family, tetracycline resistance protein
MHKKLLARGGPLGVFVEYPVLLRLACISVCAEIAWATLIAVMEYHFKDDLLRDYSSQYIASRVAMAFLAFTLCETIFKVPMGSLSDRIGARPVILVALSCAAISPLLMTFASRWEYFLPLRALDGFAAAALWPSMSALMARAVPRHAKSSAMSVFNAAYCVGLAIGPLGGLYLGHRIGNRNIFPLCSLVLLTGLIVAHFVLRSIDRSPRTGKNGPDGNERDSPHTSREVAAERMSLLRGRPMLLKMMALYALSQTAVGMLATVIPLYVAEVFDIQQADLPRLIAVPALVVALVALPLGRLADSIGRPRAVWVSYGFATVGMLLIATTDSLLVFGLGMLFMVVSFILGTPAWLGLTSLQVEDSRQAEALSMMQTAQGLGVVIGLLLVASAGHMMTQWRHVRDVIHRHAHHGVSAPVLHTTDVVPIGVWLYVAVGVFALCLLGTLLWVREPEHSAQAEAAARSTQQPWEITGV